MTSKKRRKAQQRILSEIKSQLAIKAKKLSIEDRFSEVNFEALKLDAAKRILDDLNAEKTNLEYELYMKGVLDKESTIKLEKIQTYINKAQRVIEKYEKIIEKMAEKATPHKEKAKEALKKMVPTPKISVHR
ncbi:MAG: hypothetical protein ABH860_02085 [bacterium]